MKHVFGPVSSKRLGQSLGVDLLPMKSCTWNCIYCQLGKTRKLITRREEFFPRREILDEIRSALDEKGKIDWITFVGSGETMLYEGIGWLIAEVKKLTAIPVAVITNGSLFYLPEVRREVLGADAVLPSLNAGSEELHRLIGRPASGLGFRRHVEGLSALRKEYKGKLWVEVMLLGGINDSDEALQDIASALREIDPDMVHIVLPTRPAPEQLVHLPSGERIDRAIAIFSDVATVVHPSKGVMDLSAATDLLQAVTAIVSRHPVQQRELQKAVENCFPGDEAKASETVGALLESGMFLIVDHNGEPYWVMNTQKD
ncbi:MAG: radical SAM protein [Chlorobiaceae bacterium]|nr:radical SAM protein [Chlorobiaceae bacterium]NTV60048.1 radical SAM protein [Chlorobiaceae bacterium]